MTPLRALKSAVAILEKLECKYCLVGGHAASLYRVQERLTADVDFALVANSIKKSKKIAEDCIQKLGLEVMEGIIPAGQDEEPRSSICFITATPTTNSLKGVIDILLPVLPWVKVAVERAQNNRLDLGFSHVPVITPEDLIISKCYSYRNSADRFQDLDDIKGVMQGVNKLDLDYLMSRLHELNLKIPDLVS